MALPLCNRIIPCPSTSTPAENKLEDVHMWGSWFANPCKLICLSIILGCLQVPALYAQLENGAILGTVRDPSQAVIPGAKVTLTDEQTGLVLSTTTSESGTYTFTPIKIGTYTVSAEFRGF